MAGIVKRASSNSDEEEKVSLNTADPRDGAVRVPEVCAIVGLVDPKSV